MTWIVITRVTDKTKFRYLLLDLTTRGLIDILQEVNKFGLMDPIPVDYAGCTGRVTSPAHKTQKNPTNELACV